MHFAKLFCLAAAASTALACSHPPLAGHPANTALPFFTPQRPDRSIAPAPGQRAALEDIAVPFDIEHPDAIPVGFGAGAAQYQEPLRSMLLRVEGLAGYRFDWQFNPSLGDIAMSFPGGIIVFNPNAAARVSQDAFFFTLMHECGHEVLGHASPAAIVDKMFQPWLAPTMELAADGYAASQLKSIGVNEARILTSAMEIIGNSPGDSSHPPGRVRIANIKKVLGGDPPISALPPSAGESQTTATITFYVAIERALAAAPSRADFLSLGRMKLSNPIQRNHDFCALPREEDEELSLTCHTQDYASQAERDVRFDELVAHFQESLRGKPEWKPRNTDLDGKTLDWNAYKEGSYLAWEAIRSDGVHLMVTARKQNDPLHAEWKAFVEVLFMAKQAR